MSRILIRREDVDTVDEVQKTFQRVFDDLCILEDKIESMVKPIEQEDESKSKKTKNKGFIRTALLIILVTIVLCGLVYAEPIKPSVSTLYSWESLVDYLYNPTIPNSLYFSNGGYINNVTNNAFKFYENSEDLLLTFSTNTITLGSNTGVVNLAFGDVDALSGVESITGDGTGAVTGFIKTVTDVNTSTLTAAQSGAVFHNASKTGNHIFQLPSAVAGLTYTFVDANTTAGDDLYIKAATGDTINGGTAAQYIACKTDSAGQSVTLVALDATRWEYIAYTGTWVADDSPD